jgi:hypothetical protein
MTTTLETLSVTARETAADPASDADAPLPSAAVIARRVAAFDPCVSFAAIAGEFGVSRERVRQWRAEWAASSPGGAERRRQCLAQRRRRQLLEHPSFRSFFDEARLLLPARRLGLVAAKSGFRKRVVRIDDRLAVLTAARPVTRATDGQPAYALPPIPAHAAFVYVQLGAGDFLFAPARALPARGTTFVDTPASKYQRFRRTFAAIDEETTPS